MHVGGGSVVPCQLAAINQIERGIYNVDGCIGSRLEVGLRKVVGAVEVGKAISVPAKVRSS